VTNREIAELLAKQGIEIDRHQIAVREPIKTVGEHRVTVNLHHGIEAQVVVTVVPLHEDRGWAARHPRCREGAL
jgi:large subunit ribosomal protein L9